MQDQLEHVKGLVLQIQSFSRISMTQGNNRISERRTSEDPVLIVQQKEAKALNQTNDSLQ
ncbi:rCG63642 [Rattus norvegicus]|uniref:RCG63642 n=1 Tax=Rattus norvegicus TaxID=10116 RepID=A6HXJ6_RAT|nr:rCG63642 [Rattus norvegicus]